MADYNIYIHAIGTGAATNQNPTVPWSAREGGGESQTISQTSGGSGSVSGAGVNAAFAVTRAASFAQNPDAIVSTATSVAFKFMPIVAAAYAVTRLCISIYETNLEFGVLQSGDHRRETEWQNVKTAVHNIFNPFSATLNHLRITRQWNVENQRLQSQRDLLGDSVINSYTNRGA